MLIAVLVLSACQAGVSNETPAVANAEEPIEAVVENTSSDESQNETENAVSEEGTTNETAVESAEVTTEESTEETSEATEESDEVSGFPERDKKIPGYELSMRDGSTIKLDQYDGQVVMLTFFTTW